MNALPPFHLLPGNDVFHTGLPSSYSHYASSLNREELLPRDVIGPSASPTLLHSQSPPFVLNNSLLHHFPFRPVTYPYGFIKENSDLEPYRPLVLSKPNTPERQSKLESLAMTQANDSLALHSHSPQAKRKCHIHEKIWDHKTPPDKKEASASQISKQNLSRDGKCVLRVPEIKPQQQQPTPQHPTFRQTKTHQESNRTAHTAPQPTSPAHAAAGEVLDLSLKRKRSSYDEKDIPPVKKATGPELIVETAPVKVNRVDTNRKIDRLESSRLNDRMNFIPNLLNDRMDNRMAFRPVYDSQLDYRLDSRLDIWGDSRPSDRVDKRMDYRLDRMDSRLDFRHNTKQHNNILDSRLDFRQNTKQHNHRQNTKQFINSFDRKVDNRVDGKLQNLLEHRLERELETKMDTKQHKNSDTRVANTVDDVMEKDLDGRIESGLNDRTDSKQDSRLDMDLDSRLDKTLDSRLDKGLNSRLDNKDDGSNESRLGFGLESQVDETPNVNEDNELNSKVNNRMDSSFACRMDSVIRMAPRHDKGRRDGGFNTDNCRLSQAVPINNAAHEHSTHENHLDKDNQQDSLTNNTKVSSKLDYEQIDKRHRRKQNKPQYHKQENELVSAADICASTDSSNDGKTSPPHPVTIAKPNEDGNSKQLSPAKGQPKSHPETHKNKKQNIEPVDVRGKPPNEVEEVKSTEILRGDCHQVLLAQHVLNQVSKIGNVNICGNVTDLSETETVVHLKNETENVMFNHETENVQPLKPLKKKRGPPKRKEMKEKKEKKEMKEKIVRKERKEVREKIKRERNVKTVKKIMHPPLVRDTIEEPVKNSVKKGTEMTSIVTDEIKIVEDKLEDTVDIAVKKVEDTVKDTVKDTAKDTVIDTFNDTKTEVKDTVEEVKDTSKEVKEINGTVEETIKEDEEVKDIRKETIVEVEVKEKVEEIVTIEGPDWSKIEKMIELKQLKNQMENLQSPKPLKKKRLPMKRKEKKEKAVKPLKIKDILDKSQNGLQQNSEGPKKRGRKPKPKTEQGQKQLKQKKEKPAKVEKAMEENTTEENSCNKSAVEQEAANCQPLKQVTNESAASALEVNETCMKEQCTQPPQPAEPPLQPLMQPPKRKRGRPRKSESLAKSNGAQSIVKATAATATEQKALNGPHAMEKVQIQQLKVKRRKLSVKNGRQMKSLFLRRPKRCRVQLCKVQMDGRLRVSVDELTAVSLCEANKYIIRSNALALSAEETKTHESNGVSEVSHGVTGFGPGRRKKRSCGYPYSPLLFAIGHCPLPHCVACKGHNAAKLTVRKKKKSCKQAEGKTEEGEMESSAETKVTAESNGCQENDVNDNQWFCNVDYDSAVIAASALNMACIKAIDRTPIEHSSYHPNPQENLAQYSAPFSSHYTAPYSGLPTCDKDISNNNNIPSESATNIPENNLQTDNCEKNNVNVLSQKIGINEPSLEEGDNNSVSSGQTELCVDEEVDIEGVENPSPAHCGEGANVDSSVDSSPQENQFLVNGSFSEKEEVQAVPEETNEVHMEGGGVKLDQALVNKQDSNCFAQQGSHYNAIQYNLDSGSVEKYHSNIHSDHTGDINLGYGMNAWQEQRDGCGVQRGNDTAHLDSHLLSEDQESLKAENYDAQETGFLEGDRQIVAYKGIVTLDESESAEMYPSGVYVSSVV